jgi:hypothetical protein
MIGKRLSKLLESASLLMTILATLGFFEILDEIGRYHLVDGKTSYRIGPVPKKRGGKLFIAGESLPDVDDEYLEDIQCRQ